MSMPNQWSALGPCRDRSSWQSRGDWVVNSWGKAAITIRNRISVAEMMKSLLCRSSRQASAHRLAWRPLTSSAPVTAPWVPFWSPVCVSLITNPRVQDGIQQVHDQVGNDEHQHEGGDDPDHHRALLRPDRLEDLLPDAGDVEDSLGHDGATHQCAEVDAEIGDHRDQGVAPVSYTHLRAHET